MNYKELVSSIIWLDLALCYKDIDYARKAFNQVSNILNCDEKFIKAWREYFDKEKIGGLDD